MIRIAVAALLIVSGSSVSQADLRATADRPSFSAGDIVIIERNAALAAVASEDPWLVRRILDALNAEVGASDAATSVGPEGSTPNPDLDGMDRSSAEAAHDLLQLLKQAGSGGLRK